MSEELRAAAERLSTGDGYPDGPMRLQFILADGVKLADAYLAEHPADDDEIAESGWLRSVGAVRPQAVAAETVYVLGQWTASEHGGGQYPITLTWDARRGAVDAKRAFIVRVFGFIVFMRPTRGDVRRLCKALGVELKEGGA